MKYKIQSCPNPDCKQIGVTLDVTSDMLKKIKAVHGVSDAVHHTGIGKYEILLSKGSAFEWRDILPKVEQILKQY